MPTAGLRALYMPARRGLPLRRIAISTYHWPLIDRISATADIQAPVPRMLVVTHAQSLALKAKLFRGFADPSRLAVVEALRDGVRSVSDIVELTGLTQSNTSNHLACLLDCGLVEREQRGRHAFYRLADERIGALLCLADELLSDVASEVYVCPRYRSVAEGGA